MKRYNPGRMHILVKGCLALTLMLFTGTPSLAQVDLRLFAEGLTRPVTIAHAGDRRLFVVEQEGKIRIIDSTGALLPVPFLDITNRVGSNGNEQGLLGLAFHPEYHSNGYFYVNYTDPEGNTVIARYSVSSTDPDEADGESEFFLLRFDQPFHNHNGGDLQFGPDGYLYIGTGDGGSAGDPGNRAQDSTLMLGKILRLDVDGGNPYAIPESNPFNGITGVNAEIWALGLRNPWRFSFDRETGDLWIADVGQDAIEEINFQPTGSEGGENYGWRCYEGTSIYNGQDCLPMDQYVFPVYQYTHLAEDGCSVTGGYVYRSGEFPALRGSYFFADFCNDRIYSLRDSAGSQVVKAYGPFPGNRFSTFGEDMDGALYVAGLSTGKIYKITGETETSGHTVQGEIPLRVYPNPATDRLWVETGAERKDSFQILLFDTGGSIVRSETANLSPLELNLEDLPGGIYLMEIRWNGSIVNRKIIKR